MHKHTKLAFRQINVIKSEYHKKYNTKRIYKKCSRKQINLLHRLNKIIFKILIDIGKLFKIGI